MKKRGDPFWVIGVGISAGVFFSIFLVTPDLPEDVARSMLFSIAQILVTIATLAIPISLIAAQMSIRYSTEALDVIFSRKAILFFLWLIFSAVYSMVAPLNSNQFPPKIAVGLVTSCLILLLPYFYEVKERLKPENLFKDLRMKAINEIEKTLKEKKKREAMKDLEELKGVWFWSGGRSFPLLETLSPIDYYADSLHNAIMTAYHKNDYNVAELGLSELRYLAKTVYLKHKMLARFFSGPLVAEEMYNPPIIARFLILGTEVMHNSRVFGSLAQNLRNLALDGVFNGMPELGKLVTRQFLFLGYGALDRKMDRPFREITNMLIYWIFGMAVYEGQHDFETLVSKQIRQLGLHTIDRGEPEYSKSIIIELGNTGYDTIKNGHVSKNVTDLLLSLGSYATTKNEHSLSTMCIVKLLVLAAKARSEEMKEIVDGLNQSSLNEVFCRSRPSIIEQAKKEAEYRGIDSNDFNKFINTLTQQGDAYKE